MKPIIKIENVSKRYRIGQQNGSYQNSSRDGEFNLQNHRSDEPTDSDVRGRYFWALKDISFDVRPGEVLGVIGRNGAGKSTLLKILSRITEPTEGRIELYGRLGSLLEIGTGFHPELTGRENISLNGAILGMSREEIGRKFDEIVAFAEVEKFLDTPVKRYSSGMYVRLAFAVAAHMEPDILLIDEVLAVGDLSFQNKCFNRMVRLKHKGVTILLVSHSMMAVQGVCERSIFLDEGKLAAFGETEKVIKEYQDTVRRRDQERSAEERKVHHGVDTASVSLLRFEMLGDDGKDRRRFQFGEAVRIRIHLHASRRIEAPLIDFGIKRSDGVIVCNFNNWFDNFKIDYIEGECMLEGWLPP